MILTSSIMIWVYFELIYINVLWYIFSLEYMENYYTFAWMPMETTARVLLPCLRQQSATILTWRSFTDVANASWIHADIVQ